MKENIGCILKLLRGELRQKEVAAGINVQLKRYQKWERDKCYPPMFYLKKLKEFYKLKSIEDIVYKNCEEFSDNVR